MRSLYSSLRYIALLLPQPPGERHNEAMRPFREEETQRGDDASFSSSLRLSAGRVPSSLFFAQMYSVLGGEEVPARCALRAPSRNIRRDHKLLEAMWPPSHPIFQLVLEEETGSWAGSN